MKCSLGTQKFYIDFFFFDSNKNKNGKAIQFIPYSLAPRAVFYA